MTDQTDLDSMFTTQITLRSGALARVRLLKADDGVGFGAYLEGLSAVTRGRWGPHHHDRATAEAICAALDPGDWIRVVAVIEEEATEQIIAYLMLKPGVPEDDAARCASDGYPVDQTSDCTFAPSVADEYQDQGVGSLMMPLMIAGARQLGKKRMILLGGVQATNDRAVHFYQKAGFRKIGEFFTDKDNFNMILDL